MGILRADRIAGLGGANAITGSVYFGNSGTSIQANDHIITEPSSDFTMGTGDFTLEGWFFVSSIAPDWQTLIGDTLYGDTGGFTFYVEGGNSGRLNFWKGGSSVISGGTVRANTWHHLAFSRASGTNRVYVDGVLGGVNGSDTTNYTDNELSIGANNVDKGGVIGAYGLNGFASNVRVTKGTALYTSAFTPPTVLEKRSDTVLLCCQSCGNVEQEATGKIIIGKGNAAASHFTPNSPVGFSTTTDVGSQHGTTFNGFGNFATSTYMVPPGGNTRERFPDFKGAPAASARGLFGGGAQPFSTKLNLIEFITISTTGNAQDFGDLTVARGSISGCSSNIRGVFAGGVSPSQDNTIDFVTISTTGNAADFGDLSVVAHNGCGASNSTRGVFALGDAPSYSNLIDFITISTGGTGSKFGELTQVRDQLGSCASTTRGLFAGGLVTPTPANSLTNIIDFVTISNTANAIDFGDLLQGGSNGIRRLGGLSNSTRGLFAGGEAPNGQTNIISFITMATAGDAQNFGDLSAAVSQADNGASSSVRGVFHLTSPANTTLNYVTINTLGDTTDFGDMTSASTVAGMSNGHGGLG